MHGVRLDWSDLPEHLTGWVAQVLGAPVEQATTQPGGFSPGTADRVVTAHGRIAFVKAVSTAQNPESPGLHRREGEVLASLANLGDAVAPRLLGVYDDLSHGDLASGGDQQHDDHDGAVWVALVIEDVEGRHPLLPWQHAELGATLDALTRIGAHPAPAHWPRLEVELAEDLLGWSRLLNDPDENLDPWAQQHLDELDERARATIPRLAGDAIAHTDVRADNLLVQPDGRVRVVDWPWASRGTPWFDAAALLINVRWSGDLDITPHLGAIASLGATRDDTLGLLAGLAGFCLDMSRRPSSPGLPTLRSFQRAQGDATLALLQELWP